MSYEIKSDTVIFIKDNPMQVNRKDWLLNNIGRMSIATIIDKNNINIIAYSDNSQDVNILYNIAKQHSYLVLYNPEKGDNNIDIC